MKKILSILAIIGIAILMNGCNLDEEQKYYPSIKIVDLTNGYAAPLSNHFVDCDFDGFEPRRWTNSNGWLTLTKTVEKQDYIKLTIWSKNMDNKVEIFVSPAENPEMFVFDTDDFRTNAPAIGYHLWVINLD